MDASRFDAWTRRRFGLLTGGLAASILGTTSLSLADVDAKKKKKKKKKCKKLQGKCGGKNKCCKGITCGDFGSAGKFCCHNLGESCTDLEDCCGLETICVDNVCANPP